VQKRREPIADIFVCLVLSGDIISGRYGPSRHMSIKFKIVGLNDLSELLRTDGALRLNLGPIRLLI
jgi:hypothetical protein